MSHAASAPLPRPAPAPWVWLGRLGPSLALYLIAVSLVGLGITVLFSIGQGTGTEYAVKQVRWLGIALFASLVVTIPDPERWRKLAPAAAVVGVLALILVLVPGIAEARKGARRWLDLGPMSLQVSDFAKPFLLFAFAHFLDRTQRIRRDHRNGTLLPLALVGVVVALLLLQPDFGTACLYGAVALAMLFLAGVPLKGLLVYALLGLAGIAVLVANDPIRIKRVTSYLDVEQHASGDAYQLYQGLLGFGVGGVEGVGLGNGRQQLQFLPEAHNDFILPIVGEELGLPFTAGVVVAFLAFFTVVVSRLKHAPNLFQQCLAVGAMLFVVGQAVVNVAVVTGSVPTKGMSLPFVSYGGSNLVANLVLTGLLASLLVRWSFTPRLAAREL